MIEAAAFKQGMSLLAGAVNIVATKGAAGRYGFTASAVCSVTDTPPTLLVCMNRASNSHGHFIANKILSVNVLGAQHQPIARAFSSKLSAEERFAHGAWSALNTGAPVLLDSVVSFDCLIEQTQTVGTHDIFMCRVVAVQQTQAQQGLVYFNRAYQSVG